MFDNIGGKIKGLAKAIFILGAIGAIIFGLILIFLDEYFLILGFLIALLGPILAWVGSWLLYGFGELVEKTCCNEENTRQILKTLSKDPSKNVTNSELNYHNHSSVKNSTTNYFAQKASQQKTNTSIKRCPYCGDVLKNNKCEMCGKESNF